MRKALFCLTITLFTMNNCLPQQPVQPTPAYAFPQMTTPVSQRRCGDGVCDGPENPEICPQDCAALPPEPTARDKPYAAESLNVELISRVLYGPTLGVYVSGNYLYACAGPALVIYDITDETNPEEVGHLYFETLLADVMVVDEYAYVVTAEGFYIVDISDKTDPQLRGKYNSGNSQGIYVVYPYAYVCDWDNGLYIINISDPDNPSLVSQYVPISGRAMEVVVDGNHAYIGTGSSGLCILDISNPSEPTLVKYVPTNFARGIDKVGDYVHIADGSNPDQTEGYFKVVDVSTPSQAHVTGELSLTGGTLHMVDVSISDNYAYVANFRQAEVYVVDISDPENPTVAGVFSATHSVPARIQTLNERAYIAWWDAGWRIVDISNPTDPQQIHRETTGSWNSDVSVQGSHLYVSVFDDYNLDIVDISDITNPKRRGRWAAEVGAGHGMDVYGNYAYIANGFALEIVDVSDPDAPFRVGGYPVVSDASEVYLDTTQMYAYVTDGTKVAEAPPYGLRVIDVSDPSNPTLVGSLDINTVCWDVDKQGDYAYVAADEGGLRVIDVSNPSTLIEVGHWNPGTGEARGVDVQGNHAYVAYRMDSGGGGLRVIDISNPSAPSQVGSYTDGDITGCLDVQVEGDQAYILGFRALKILDISNPTNPHLIGYYKPLAEDMETQEGNDGNNGRLCVDENYIYVANRAGGVYIFRFRPSDIATINVDCSVVTDILEDPAAVYAIRYKDTSEIEYLDEMGIEVVHNGASLAEAFPKSGNPNADPDDPNEYDFTAIDEALSAVVAADRKTVFDLWGLNPILTKDGKKTGCPKDQAQYEKLVRNVARHLTQGWPAGGCDGHRWGEYIYGWKHWNEPNLRSFWSGTMEEYLQTYATWARALNRLTRISPSSRPKSRPLAATSTIGSRRGWAHSWLIVTLTG